MGLDMFLKRKLPIFSYGDEPTEVEVTKGGKPLPYVNNSKIIEIVEEVGYWRKFNALHNWFVENVQSGLDKCQLSEVSIEDLKSLLALLKEVHNDPNKPDVAETLLPTADGFFFGGTQYDEYYYQDVEETIELLEKIISDEEKYELYAEYYYRASW